MRRDSHWCCVFINVAAWVYHIASEHIENNEIDDDPVLIGDARSRALPRPCGLVRE